MPRRARPLETDAQPSSALPKAGIVAIAATAFAYSLLMQGGGSVQTSHYALVKALASGTATIDRSRFETGDVPTADFAYFQGHYYSNKAPGLAFATLPVYLALRQAGVRTTGDPTVMLWALGLLGCVVPVLLTLLLVARLGDQLEPGHGTAAAVTLGLGTLLFPFGTMFFAHALSAFLAFAAFAVLWRERRGRPRLGLVAAAGAVAGLAVTTEYPLAIAAAILGLCAVARQPRLSRAGAYVAGVFLGVAPLMLYQRWAFGSFLHSTYSGTVAVPGRTGHDVVVQASDLFNAPSLRVMAELLVSRWGLLVTAPVLVSAGGATAALFRRGQRAEALVISAIAIAYTTYISGYFLPFGSVPPGPRFLIPVLPFLAVPLAIAFRAAFAPTAVLALASVAVMTAVSVTRPHMAWDGHVLDRLTSPAFEGYSRTALDIVSVTGWYNVLPLAAAIIAAVSLAVVATPRPRVAARDGAAAAAAVGAWAAVALGASAFVDRGVGGALVALALTGIATVAVLGLERFRRAQLAAHSSDRSC
jgi:4-amino-4-deoxy-L-arabinose transferase-like glycosyltransferase